jgi:hypothetical protein
MADFQKQLTIIEFAMLLSLLPTFYFLYSSATVLDAFKVFSPIIVLAVSNELRPIASTFLKGDMPNCG